MAQAQTRWAKTFHHHMIIFFAWTSPKDHWQSRKKYSLLSLPLLFHHFNFHPSLNSTMAPLQRIGPPIIQKFKSANGTLLASLPTHVCTETGERYVLWRDIQDTFKGADHLLDLSKEVVLFTIDNDGEM